MTCQVSVSTNEGVWENSWDSLPRSVPCCEVELCLVDEADRHWYCYLASVLLLVPYVISIKRHSLSTTTDRSRTNSTQHSFLDRREQLQSSRLPIPRRPRQDRSRLRNDHRFGIPLPTRFHPDHQDPGRTIRTLRPAPYPRWIFLIS